MTTMTTITTCHPRLHANKLFGKQYAKPTKVIYATDLHFSPETDRLKPFIDMLNKVRSEYGSNCVLAIGGDFAPVRAKFNVRGMSVWDLMGKTALTMPERQMMYDFSRETVENTIPKIIEATPDMDRILISGNRDWLAYSYIREHYSAAFTFLKNNPVIKHYMNKLTVLYGFNGINREHSNESMKIFSKNPWYGGITPIKPKVLPMVSILMTHTPALGIMDLEEGAHKGCEHLLNYIKKQSPMLHLTGHIHDAPMEYGLIYQWRTNDLRNTVTVNPGGHYMHDSGIRMCVIDLPLISIFAASKQPPKDEEMLREAVKLIPSE